MNVFKKSFINDLVHKIITKFTLLNITYVDRVRFNYSEFDTKSE